jgi:hypothetical protein
MNHAATRPGWHAVGGPVERPVRPQSVRRGGGHDCLVPPARLSDKCTAQVVLGEMLRLKPGLEVLADKGMAR